METLFNIYTENGQFYYTLFYKLSFLLGFLLFVYIGFRRKYSMPTWLLIGTVGSVFFIIGTKIGTYSWENWSTFFTEGYFEETHSKSLVGGLLLGLIGILLTKKWFRFQPSLLDAYALILPIALIVQRVGCFMAGCCFGIPSSVPWGVKYAAHFPVYEHHQNQNLLTAVTDTALSIHPVPLYLILVYLIVLFVVWKTKDFWKLKGSLALFSISMLMGLRFFVEFFRDPATNHAFGDFVFGIKGIQWLLLLLVIFFSSIIFVRERYGFLVFKPVLKPLRGLGAHVFIVLVLLFMVWLGRGWFTMAEAMIIQCKMLLILLILAFQLWKHRQQNYFKYKMVGFTLLSLLLMGQTYDKSTKIISDSTKNKTHILNFGLRYSDTDLVYTEKEYVGSGCNRSLVRSEVIELSPAYSLGFQYLQKTEKERRKAKNKHKPNKEFIFGAGLTFSAYERKSLLGSSFTETSIGANILFGEDYKNFGYKLGAHLGRYTMLTPLRSKNNVLGREQIVNVFPISEIRIGPKQLHVVGSVGADFPYDILTSRYKVGLGLNARLFKLKNDSGLEFGFAENIDHSAFYADARFNIDSRFLIQPGVRFGKYPIYGIAFKYKLK